MKLTQSILYGRCKRDHDCRLWTQATNNDGCPYVWHEGKTTNARRLSYELHHGKPLKKGLILYASCEHPNCIFAEHLIAISRGMNQRRLARLGAFSSASATVAKTHGKRNSASTKLDMERARAIRASQATGAEEARRHGISRSLVTQIRKGRIWREHIANATIFAQAA